MNNKTSLFSTGLSDENRDVRLLYKRLAARDGKPVPYRDITVILRISNGWIWDPFYRIWCFALNLRD